MKSSEIIADSIINEALECSGFKGYSPDEGRLYLSELMIKAQAGCYNSHTEEVFLRRMEVTKKDRTPNFIGRRFLLSMFYCHSNKKPEAYRLMTDYRK